MRMMKTSEIQTTASNRVEYLLKEGDFFGNYRILRTLGAGGMAEVYLAEHLLVREPRALKLIKQTGQSSDFHSRFLREAKLTQALKDPHIVHIHGVGFDEKSGYIFLDMEFIDGISLDSFDSQKLSIDSILQVATDIGHAIKALERAKIVHRDIKPSNIMKEKNGRYKLMDLGIAKFDNVSMPTGEYTLTQENSLIGTPAYASPEQCRSAHTADFRSDIYSLGATLYHLASGKAPYQGETPIAIMLDVIQKEPVPLAKLRKDLPRPLTDLIHAMMQKDPEKRPQNAEELLDRLESINRDKFKYFFRKFLCAFLLPLLGTACLACAGMWIWEKCGTARQTPVPPESRSVPPSVPERKTSFSMTEFIHSHTRTLACRLEETGKALAFLRAPDAEKLPRREERIALLEAREKLLRALIAEKEQRKQKAVHPPASDEQKKRIGNYLKNRITTFRHVLADHFFGQRIMEEINAGKLDPDAVFPDYSGKLRSLVDLTVNGYIVHGAPILDSLIRAGADIDAFKEQPIRTDGHSSAEEFQAFQLFKMLVFAGYDNVDYYGGESMLLLCFKDDSVRISAGRARQNYDWDFAQKLILAGCVTNQTDRRGRSIIHYAAICGKHEILEKILLTDSSAAGDIDHAGKTPYQYAVRNDSWEVRSLLERFGITSELTKEDIAAGRLKAAVRLRDMALAKEALDSGADISFVYDSGLNVLQYAVLAGHLPMVEFLLQKGANPLNSEDTVSAYEMAVSTGQPAVLDLLLTHVPLKDFTRKKQRGIIYLPHLTVNVWDDNTEKTISLLNVLLRHGWRVDDTPEDHPALLALSVSRENPSPDLVKFLLEHGADPFRKDSAGHIALQKAKNPEIKKLLISAMESRRGSKK